MPGAREVLRRAGACPKPTDRHPGAASQMQLGPPSGILCRLTESLPSRRWRRPRGRETPGSRRWHRLPDTPAGAVGGNRGQPQGKRLFLFPKLRISKVYRRHCSTPNSTRARRRGLPARRFQQSPGNSGGSVGTPHFPALLRHFVVAVRLIQKGTQGVQEPGTGKLGFGKNQCRPFLR